MSRIVALSSYVAHGHIGLSAIVPVLKAQGHDVIALPTVILSNHTGHPHVGGFSVPTSEIDAMAAALAANAGFSAVGAVLTGYLPSSGHVAAAVRLVDAIRDTNPAVLVVCDPIIGDFPKGLYVDTAAARAIRDDLLPLADLAIPNGFELEWLSGRPTGTPSEAVDAARALPCPQILATSIPDGDARLATVLVDGDGAASLSGPRLSGIPHGPGDLLSGLVTALLTGGSPLRDAVSRACGALELVLECSRGRPDLDLSPLIVREIPSAKRTLAVLDRPRL